MQTIRSITAAALVQAGLAAFALPPPPAPGPESWAFRQELQEEESYRAREAYRIVDGYGLAGNLETVKSDLERFFASAGKPAAKTLKLTRAEVDGRESYRIDVAADGSVEIAAGDDDGMRRGVYYFEDRIAAGDLRPCRRRPWLSKRISRCYFSPIKRPPFNRDELADDIDYYPDAYLNRLAHEGVNGLWLTVELRDVVETSFGRRRDGAGKRLAKLRRTVEKCNRYGIRTWIFGIEPRFFSADDPIVKEHPDMFSDSVNAFNCRLLCPSSPKARRYIEESLADLFRQVPGLPGFLNLSHGERPTTCLSLVDPTVGSFSPCRRCRTLEPWRMHALSAQSFVKGMRSVNPEAEFLSWFYQPHVVCNRAKWVFDVPRHLPEGVTMVYNFESGAVKEQLGRYRSGGDYWLSYAGPAPAFERVADAGRGAQASIGAKIQVGCSHECATVPFVPVPGLLYRKYREMKDAGCSAVMQCWYFGNYPGVMNKAAGELAFCDFSQDEDGFLEHLAAPEWGEDAAAMAGIWRLLSDAYANYPLSNDMQYYGPFHAGIAWPLEATVKMLPLARTWKPHDPPSGDAIGECLENHTLDEATVLASRMERLISRARPEIDRLCAKHAHDRRRMRDLGVMRAMGILFESAFDILEFYRQRARAVAASRLRGDAASALRSLEVMKRCVLREKRLTAEMKVLAASDSRLGFHSEAEAHQFHPARLEWRQGELDRTLSEIADVEAALGRGEMYPLSEHEKSAGSMVCGRWLETEREFRLVRWNDRELDEHQRGSWVPGGRKFRFRASFGENGDMTLEGEVPDGETLELRTTDACGASWPKTVVLHRNGKADTSVFNVITPGHDVRGYEVSPAGAGWRFKLVLGSGGWGGTADRRPAWICFRRGSVPVWPEAEPSKEYRLNIGNVVPTMFGRIAEEQRDIRR